MWRRRTEASRELRLAQHCLGKWRKEVPEIVGWIEVSGCSSEGVGRRDRPRPLRPARWGEEDQESRDGDLPQAEDSLAGVRARARPGLEEVEVCLSALSQFDPELVGAISNYIGD